MIPLQFDGSFKSPFFEVVNIDGFEKADSNILFKVQCRMSEARF